MASYEFTATHGVQLGDLGVQFTHDPGLDAPDGARRYRHVTADAATARRLRRLAADGMYGITETKAAPGERDNDDG